MTCTDLFSKWPDAYATKSKEAVEVAKVMIRIFSTYGFPKVVLSDNGAEFCNAVSRTNPFCPV